MFWDPDLAPRGRQTPERLRLTHNDMACLLVLVAPATPFLRACLHALLRCGAVLVVYGLRRSESLGRPSMCDSCSFYPSGFKPLRVWFSRHGSLRRCSAIRSSACASMSTSSAWSVHVSTCWVLHAQLNTCCARVEPTWRANSRSLGAKTVVRTLTIVWQSSLSKPVWRRPSIVCFLLTRPAQSLGSPAPTWLLCFATWGRIGAVRVLRHRAPPNARSDAASFKMKSSVAADHRW